MAPPDTMKPKTRAALIGAVLLVLGFASGAMLYGPSAPGPITVVVPGALHISASCGSAVQETEEPDQPLSMTPGDGRCTVTARMSDDRVLTGPLEVGQAPRHRCLPDGDALLCGVSP